MRRRRLLMVSILLLAAVVMGLFAAWQFLPKEETVAVLVARQNLAQWTPVYEPDALFETMEVAKSKIPAGYVSPDAKENLQIRPHIKQVRQGQILTWDDVQRDGKAGIEIGMVDPGFRSFRLTVPPSWSGALLPGTNVDVVHMPPDGPAEYLVENVLVRMVEHAPPDGDRGFRTVTLRVTNDQALRLAEGVERGKAFLTMRPFGDD